VQDLVPWYSLGLASLIQDFGTKYSASFTKLNGAMSVSRVLLRSGNAVGEGLGALGAGASVVDVLSARQLCRKWKEVLANG
jgi:hypothetical protein